MMGKRNFTNDIASVWFYAPFVIAMRCQAFAVAGLLGQPQDRRELGRMVSEKADASLESAAALNVAVARQGLDFFNSVWLGQPSYFSGKQGEKFASAALRPYAKRVRANTRRLTAKKTGR